MYKIYCDGASRSNPGEASVGISIQNDEQEVDTIAKKIGVATNNVAEYEGLRTALDYCHKNNLKDVVIQGGLDPKILLKSDDAIFEAATKYIRTFKDTPYIFNLGHGLLPETDPDKVDKLIKFYRNFNG